jgi:hybrid cluster-associated redox disulfide protein
MEQVLLGIFMVIQKDTRINEIISAYPDAIKFFSDLKMSCGSCFAVNFDTVENGALMHDMDVDTLVVKLNKFLEAHHPAVTPTEQK